MKLLINNFSTKFTSNCLLIIGNFDGLHKGHLSILSEAINLKKQKSYSKIGLLTFEPNPKEFFFNLKNFKITKINDKIEILKKLKIDFLHVVKFNKKFRNFSAEDFCKKILKKKINPSTIIVGKEFKFGKNRSGNIQFLKNFFNIKIAKQKKINNLKISSSTIRKFLQQGKIKQANHLLGRHWSISGKVVKGNRIGRKIGFKTANVYLDEYVNPMYGVYAVKVKFDNKIYKGISNFGIAPTIRNNKKPVLEIHFFKKIKNIYNKTVNVDFISFVRKEKKFKSKKNLTGQIKKDINKAKKILENAR